MLSSHLKDQLLCYYDRKNLFQHRIVSYSFIWCSMSKVLKMSYFQVENYMYVLLSMFVSLNTCSTWVLSHIYSNCFKYLKSSHSYSFLLQNNICSQSLLLRFSHMEMRVLFSPKRNRNDGIELYLQGSDKDTNKRYYLCVYWVHIIIFLWFKRCLRNARHCLYC